ncbi:CesT family type III secretion system chaperone [Ramlibacter sp.]|uniref:CesT family type III secretion system chaperone n=1 Tax=Ramlibacter sp. TaxID=1917967 RepID=UPI003D1295EE
MNTANFRALCAAYCEGLGVACPDLVPDDDGLVAFHLERRGVSIDAMFYPEMSTEGAFILFELGPMRDHEHAAPDIMRALLRANFLSLQGERPSFACHPLSGDAVLQCVCPLADTSAGKFTQLIEDGVALALRWRKGFFLEALDAAERQAEAATS